MAKKDGDGAKPAEVIVRSSWWSKFAVMGAWLTAIASIWLAWESMRANVQTLGNNLEIFARIEAELQRELKLTWQKVLVFQIIEDQFFKNNERKGVTYSDIQKEYAQKITTKSLFADK